MKTFSALITIALFSIMQLCAQDAKTTQLPAPAKDGGKPLMQALQLRSSARTFATKPVSMQDLSDLLWAADGVNRPESNHLTAPSARNWQDVSIYVITPEATYLYIPKGHQLIEILHEDIRNLAGLQDYAKTAPLNLIYVSDQAKMDKTPNDDKWLLSGADAAFIAENVYLFCASRDFNVVIRAMIDKEALAKKLNLKPEQKIILGQTIGYKN